MPLNKQLVPIDFTESSTDTKGDPKVSAKFVRIENMFKKRTGELRKRYGFDALPSTVFSGDTAIADNIYVSDFNKELVAITSNDIYSYSEGQDKWKEIDDDFKLWNMDSIKTLPASDLIASHVVYSGLYYFLVTVEKIATSAYIYKYAFIDYNTEMIVKSGTLQTTSNLTGQIKIALNASYFYVAYLGSDLANALVLKSFDRTTLAETATYKYTTYAMTSLDMIVNGSYVYMAAQDSNSNKIQLFRNNAGSLTNVNTILIGSALTSTNAPVRITLQNAASSVSNLIVNYTDFAVATRTLYYSKYDYTLTELQAPLSRGTIGGTLNYETENIMAYIDQTDSNIAHFLASYTTESGIFSQAATLKISIDLTTAGVLASNTIPGLKVQSNAFLLGTTPYTIFSQNIPYKIDNYILYQGTAYLYNLTTGKTEGVISVGTFNSQFNKAEISNYSYGYVVSDKIYYPSIEKVDDINKVVSIKKIYQDITKLSMPAKTNNELIIPGLMPMSYIGTALIDINYAEYPVIHKYVNSGAGTGLTTGKTYQYCLVYSYVDKNGIKRRSAVSNILTMVKTDAFIWTIYFNGSLFTRNEQNIEIYRTEGDGSIFYFVASVPDVIASVAAGKDLNFSDTIQDATIVNNQILYTTGGVLEADLPTNAGIVKILKNRLFMARCEKQDRVYYSKELAANYAPEMSSNNVIEFFDSEGPVVGCAELDEKLFFFKENAIFYLFGDLNNDLGQGQNVTPLRIPGNIGLTDYQAIIEFSEGIIFKSARGFYLVDRGLNVSYIGAPVEYYNNLNISSSTLMTQYNQIRFTNLSGNCLVYDYYWKEWYVYTNIQATSATNWEGSFVFAKSNGVVLKENTASWQDIASYLGAATPITSKVQTGWINFAGMSGYQRIYRGLILGEYRGAHTLKVSVATNYNPYYDEQFTLATSVLTGAVTSDASYYGNYSTDSTDSVYQFQFRPMNQKCESMQLLIEDSFSTGNEGFTISGISAVVGSKAGAFKLPATKTMNV